MRMLTKAQHVRHVARDTYVCFIHVTVVIYRATKHGTKCWHTHMKAIDSAEDKRNEKKCHESSLNSRYSPAYNVPEGKPGRNHAQRHAVDNTRKEGYSECNVYGE